MSYRNHLPQLDGGLFLTDGGIETTLIFHEGLDLPAFAAFDDVFGERQRWHERIRGLRANASTKSHAELDEATELDEGDSEDLGARYAALGVKLPELNVLGGCCGTDHRHVREVCNAWLAGATANAR
jgi:S-methylmethionine-dependent homocysteine/selenocysteine methylase